MSYSSNIKPLYIPGHPDISLPDEDRADSWLHLSRKLWDGHNVSYYRDEPEYSKQGSIRELYHDTLNNLDNYLSGPFCCCAFPALFLATYAFCHLKFANDVTEFIGLHMKEKALERNPKAKEYNKLAADYLEELNRPEYADKILETHKLRKEELEAVFSEITESHPQFTNIEKKLKQLELDISIMESSLRDYQNAPINFEKNVRGLIDSHDFK